VVDRFWLDGPLAISAVEQTEFLGRLVAGKLPVSAETVGAVKEITLLEKTETCEIHGKTEWLLDAKQQIGWWSAGSNERESFIPSR
jgi:beta-lactamase class D